MVESGTFRKILNIQEICGFFETEWCVVRHGTGILKEYIAFLTF